MLRTDIYWVMADVSERNAGYRLRTKPLADKLTELGYQVYIISEQELTKQIKTIAEQANIVISAKPSKTRMYLCLNYLSQNNVRVVVDLFDNYFSWSPSLYQFGVYWNWLRVAQVASQVSVSTRFLKNTVERLRDASACCLIPDPLPSVLHALPSYFTEGGKWDSPSVLEFLWFGINNNPYFQAGLEDLASWMRIISKINAKLDHKFNIKLTVCTKRVPEAETLLYWYRQHAIDCCFVEWTEEACQALIAQSHVVLIPSNLTGFSLSKTHNRCSDALARGCLVLSSPHGPYYHIEGGGVLSSVNELCDLLLSAAPSLVQNRLQQSLEFIQHDSEVNLLEQLRLDTTIAVSTSPAQELSKYNRPILILTQTTTDTAKLARSLNYLVASFKNSGVNASCDIVLDGIYPNEHSVTLVLTKAAFDYFTHVIVTNAAREWSKHKTGLCCHLDGWEFNFDSDSLMLTVKSNQLSSLLLKASIYEQDVFQKLYYQGGWYATNVELLCTILNRLDLPAIDFACDGSYGWQEFSHKVDGGLENLSNSLYDLWQVFRSNEIQIGRPQQ